MHAYIWEPLSKIISGLLLFFVKHFFHFLFLYFYGRTWSIKKFPEEGSIWSCSCRPTPQPQQCQIRAASVTYATAGSNTRSLTQWMRPGIEPTSSQRWVRFLICWATLGPPFWSFWTWNHRIQKFLGSRKRKKKKKKETKKYKNKKKKKNWNNIGVAK